MRTSGRVRVAVVIAFILWEVRAGVRSRPIVQSPSLPDDSRDGCVAESSGVTGHLRTGEVNSGALGRRPRQPPVVLPAPGIVWQAGCSESANDRRRIGWRADVAAGGLTTRAVSCIGQLAPDWHPGRHLSHVIVRQAPQRPQRRLQAPQRRMYGTCDTRSGLLVQIDRCTGHGGSRARHLSRCGAGPPAAGPRLPP